MTCKHAFSYVFRDDCQRIDGANKLIRAHKGSLVQIRLSSKGLKSNIIKGQKQGLKQGQKLRLQRTEQGKPKCLLVSVPFRGAGGDSNVGATKIPGSCAA